MQTDREDGFPPTRILLLIENERNRALLAEQLDDEFEVRTEFDEPLADVEYDVCLVDSESLDRREAELRRAKTAAAPTFRPHLLLAGRESPDRLPAEVWEVVDEVIRRPVNKVELDARLRNLLQRRRLSVELTRQKEASEQRFESLFESTPDPVVVVKPDGTVTEANSAFGRTFGVDEEELRSRPITDLEFEPSASVERVLLRIDDDDVSETTVEWRANLDEPLVMELNTEVISDIGDAAERIGIFRDITDRKKREEELRQQNDRLKEFADTVAHDLRNPLNIARGRLDMAEQTGDPEHFDTIRSSHERMEQMIEELLSLAKQGQTVLEPDSISVADAVTDAWEHVESPDASLAVTLDESTVVTADESRFSQLFENLFRNAIEHGGDTVTVRVGALPDATGIYVEDDGPGIPADKRTEVFEGGYTETDEGTGFGLSIVRQIVDGHEWDIEATVADDGGARFEITNMNLQSE